MSDSGYLQNRKKDGIIFTKAMSDANPKDGKNNSLLIFFPDCEFIGRSL